MSKAATKEEKNTTSKAKAVDDILKDVYYNPKSSASYSGVLNVLREAKKIDNKITRTEVKKFLEKQRVYTLYKALKRKGKTLRTVPSGLHTHWACDLAVFSTWKKDNDDYRYLLVCIDSLSRMLYVQPLRTKAAKDVIPAFDEIFERAAVRPWFILSDKGWEFNSRRMREYWGLVGIEKHVSENPVLHATQVERAIRTIRERLVRVMAQKGTTRWLDLIQAVVNAINNTPHTSTGMAPADVNFQNASTLYHHLYDDYFKEENRGSNKNFKVGDTVRIDTHKDLFSKGHTKFTDEIFRINKIFKKHNPIVYQLVDLEDEEIKGKFYANNLCKASLDTTWRIEVLDSRKRKGIKEYKVRWIGYPKKYTAWLSANEIISPD